MNNLDERISSHLRIIDANLNRLREGLRVIEDIFRYIFNNQHIAYKIKELRHNTKISIYEQLLNSRDSLNDCLKTSTKNEKSRELEREILDLDKTFK